MFDYYKPTHVIHCMGKVELGWEKYVKQDDKFLRPEELHNLKETHLN
jgi:hypothetical protein